MAENTDRGPLPPYGPAIWDAAKRGDLQEMEHIADAARHAIARSAAQEGVQISESTSSAATHFRECASHEVVEVREALTHLEGKINELRASKAQQPPEQS
ncbi:MAG: DUF1843 domain-containing protein [Candidatus Eremiobacteraeota bacterium]|nr:DUF1843 domain-containing protein [Candidatus Eremiobacteraeota bacterium]MBV8371203.1 DUF1843 domain-containing protein [Candidatus Eremiobacteraeota bacterium]